MAVVAGSIVAVSPETFLLVPGMCPLLNAKPGCLDLVPWEPITSEAACSCHQRPVLDVQESIE